MPWRIAKNVEGCPDGRPWAVVEDGTDQLFGCHASEEDAEFQMSALVELEEAQQSDQELSSLAAELADTYSGATIVAATDGDCPQGHHRMPDGSCMPNEDMDLDGPMRQWSGILAMESTETGDGREFASESLEWPDLAEVVIPLMWQRESEPQHNRSIVVGRINRIERDGDVVRGWGVIKADAEVTPDLEAGLAGGVSVDVDSVKDTDVEMVFPDEVEGAEEDDDIIMLFGPPPDKVVFHRGRIRGATLVSVPAFVEARIHLVEPEQGDNDALSLIQTEGTFEVIGNTDLPIADRETEWDGQAARNRVFNLCSDDNDNVDVDCVSRAFLWRDPDANPTTRGAYSLGFADVINGQLQIVPRGVSATAGGRGVDAADIPEDDKRRIRSRICTLYDHIQDSIDDWPDCPFERNEESAMTRNAVTASATARFPIEPPMTWFQNPSLEGPTSWTVTDDGRVYGHLALWSTCHTTFPDRCVTPPRESDYPYFMRSELKTSDGVNVGVGPITLGTGHAALRLGAVPAVRHYDDTGLAAVDVTLGEDRYGIWVAGALRPTVNDIQLRELRGSSLSGDWRRIGGNLRLVAVLAVNVPGFPVPKMSANIDSSESFASMVAAGVVTESRMGAMKKAMMGDDGTIRVRKVKR